MINISSGLTIDVNVSCLYLDIINTINKTINYIGLAKSSHLPERQMTDMASGCSCHPVVSPNAASTSSGAGDMSARLPSTYQKTRRPFTGVRSEADSSSPALHKALKETKEQRL